MFRRVRYLKSVIAVLAGLSVGLAVVAGLRLNAPDHVAPTAFASTPFAAGAASGNGAANPLNITEYEAEGTQASTKGSAVGPDYTQGDLASEASGRQAVQLKAEGQYVKFTLTAPANAFDLHYAVPQGQSGKLSVYVNGTKLSSELQLTSAYSYITTPGIGGSKQHKLYDDARMMLPGPLKAGATVAFQVDAGDTALPYTLDVADFFDVPAPASRPSGSVSVVHQGADPTGVADSTKAFNSAVDAANAAGVAVWIPAGSYLITSPLHMQKATIIGAGSWYSQIKTNMFIRNGSAVPGPINLSGFAILGSTVGRHDDSTANAIDGSLGKGSVVDGLWIQDTNAGFWLQYGNSGITVKNCIVFSTDADGLNFNGNATNDTVKNNFLRNTGDDALAIWSYPAADSGITFANNTIVQPTLANGIADYGGSDNTIKGNVIADTNALGSGIAISNEAFLQPFAALSGTITVSDNTLIRAGAMNPNWNHPMGAMRFDSYDSAFQNVTVDVSGNTIVESPYSAFEIVSGGGKDYTVSGLKLSNNKVNWTGTTLFQAETPGSASVSGLSASNVGVTGAYNYGYHAKTSGAFTFNAGSGNSGWSTTPALDSFSDPVGLPPAASGSAAADPSQATTTDPSPASASASASTHTHTHTQTPTAAAPAGGNLALGGTADASGHTQDYVPANAVDREANTYWESTDNAFPQWFQVKLRQNSPVGRIVMKLPPYPAWGARTQTITIQGSTDGSTWTTLAGSAGYTFDPSSGNAATATFSAATVRYLRLTFTANTGWPAGQLSRLQAFSS
ncbi:discoidin domain-containing protein [Streptomyces sp. NPDC048527]|uniref:discoidin domain-containing protein n=1 Tax=Streptomyces sp. NPDC048527 TaxID=3365568 RepID=UPI003720B5B8